MIRRIFYFSLLFFSFLLFSACNPTRQLPENQYLLSRNSIEVEDTEVSRNELKNFIRQKTNRKILGVYRFHLNVYQLADRGKETGFKNWMKNTIGEPPVIYDPIMSENTVRQFEMYLHSKGYFNAEVDYKDEFRRRRAYVTYRVKGNEPYTINRIDYNILDPYLETFVHQDTIHSLIEHGQRYDEDKLQEERNRISRSLRNQGYYRFSRDFIHFRVDSSLNARSLNIELLINNPVEPVPGIRDSVVEKRHRRFLIDKVEVLPNYSPLSEDIPREDTTIYRSRVWDSDERYKYYFLHNQPLRIKPSVITNHVNVLPGEYFRIKDVEQTYNFLSEMRNYRFINLHFSEPEKPIHGTPTDTLGFLNASVQLNRSAANAFTVEAEGLNTAGNLGVASNILYQNRNIFRGAEIFNLRFKGALEVSGESGREEVIQRLPFNTLELGVEMGIDFPKLIVPFALGRLSRNTRPKSSVVTGVNFRQRPDYTRYILNLNYGFEWNQTPQRRHFINPIEISSVRVFNDSILRANIPDANPFILSRFKDHFILGLKYTYVYNTQEAGRPRDFMYLRTNFESAGNLLSASAGPMGLSRDGNGSYSIFNIPFSQFVKADADYRYYRVFDERQTLVFRLMGGVGVPYGNVEVLPFIKSYYGGGSNGMRAWRIYTLGPGSYEGTDEVRFDRYGDIKLEANVEYRFRFYGLWHGAFFLDTGNVWFVRENEQFPGGEFKVSEIGSDIAVGAGFGIRLDFNFFVLRVDAAFPVKDPSVPASEQWVSSWPAFSDYNLNLGIGYPF